MNKVVDTATDEYAPALIELSSDVFDLENDPKPLEAGQNFGQIIAGIDLVVLDIVGGAVAKDPRQSKVYRQVGEDTLTWGDQNEWILANWLVKTTVGQARREWLDEYSDLLTVLVDLPLEAALGNFLIKNPSAIESFLRSNTHLISVLLNARQIIADYFGSESEVLLELITDPEARDYTRLFAYVKTDLKLDVAFERLSQLDDEWLIDQPNDVLNIFNIDFVAK